MNPLAYFLVAVYLRVAFPIVLTAAALSWAAAAFVWLVLWPTSFLVACAAVVAVVLRHRAVARRAVRDATLRQLAFAQVIRFGGRR